jgi:hypothetical protein
MHSRDVFEDNETHIRYLIRIWLKNKTLVWKLPPALERGNRYVYFDEELQENWTLFRSPD